MAKTSIQKFITRSRAPRVQIEYDVEVYGAESKVQIPFVMGVMADLSGNPEQALPSVGDRKFLDIDIDNFDSRMNSMKPRVVFSVTNTLDGEDKQGEETINVDITFECMHDFSPAAVAVKVDGLKQLLEARTLLANLLTYMDGKADAENLIAKALNDTTLIRSLVAPSTADSVGDSYVTGRVDEPGVQESVGNDKVARAQRRESEATTLQVREFNSLLEKEFKFTTDQRKDTVEKAVQTLAESVVRYPDFVSDNAIQSIESIIGEIDKGLTRQLNLILHHEDFQKVEGSWRGLHYLVNNTETDEMLKIRIMDISKKEAHKTLKKYRGTAWDQSPLFKRIYEEEYGQFGGEPYGCIIGDYYFSHKPEDCAFLGEMAKVCAAAHTPFIAGFDPEALGMESWQELANPRALTMIFQTPEYAPWRSLRESEDSRYLGLVMPRFLSRLPYGSKTYPVSEFDFEEDTENANHKSYTWANGAYAMAANINAAFKFHGWCAQIRGVESGGAVMGLPTHTFPTDDGGMDMKCPTEIAISDRREAELAKNGIMPLIHKKNTDFAAFIGAQSLLRPAEYDDPEATANANLGARLPYLFATSRFAHYLKCIVRDKIGAFKEREDMEAWLNNWIGQYVIALSDPLVFLSPSGSKWE